MAKDIGVFINDSGVTASLSEQGKLCVYRKRQGAWYVAREKVFGLDQSGNLRALRAQMSEVLDFLGDCPVFVALSVVGVPYFELEKAHINVWEFEGKPREFLDYIWEQEEIQRQDKRKEERVVIPVPVETENGYYQISIKEIQESNTGITSKQVLLPFLHSGRFYELEVTCSHIPPWLEAEFAIGNLTGRIEKKENREIKVTITRKCCES